MLPPPAVTWDDVAFDERAAEEAAVACDRLRATVEDVLDWSVAASARVEAGWGGGLADEFSVSLRAVQQRLQARADELVRLAAALRRAADDAGAEQARRERARKAWHAWRAWQARQASA